MATASWYHCTVKPVSRSAGRSVVAAAAYRLGERLHDERYDIMHDYTRRRGVESTFTVAARRCAGMGARPEAIMERRRASGEAQKQHAWRARWSLPCPRFLSPDDRQRIAEQFARELVERYNVAVSVAIHEPGKDGDQRNYHAHILFTTREMTPGGLGKENARAR